MTTFITSVTWCPPHGNTNSTLDGIRYPSTSLLFGLNAILSLCLGSIILAFYNGMKFYSVQEDPETGSWRMKTRKKKQKATDNQLWALFFASNFVQYVIEFASVQIPQLSSDNEARRIVLLIACCAVGASCFMLTLALNHQRIHRHKDYNAVPTANTGLLQLESKKMLHWSVIFYAAYIGAEFIASHVTDTPDVIATISFWLYIAALIGLIIPPLFATFWVMFHQGEFHPTKGSKIVLLIGAILHFLSMLPPSFWTRWTLGKWTETKPCPFHFMSFYDCFLVLAIVRLILLYCFTIAEFKRNSVALLHDEFARYSERLDAGGPGSLQGDEADP